MVGWVTIMGGAKGCGYGNLSLQIIEKVREGGQEQEIYTLVYSPKSEAMTPIDVNKNIFNLLHFYY